MKKLITTLTLLLMFSSPSYAEWERVDEDADGVITSDDCDDTESSVYLDAPEICDGLDNDCDTLTDDADDNLILASRTEWYHDSDGDGYGDPSDMQELCDAPTDYIDNNEDCNDDDASISPDALEYCDGIDNIHRHSDGNKLMDFIFNIEALFDKHEHNSVS